MIDESDEGTVVVSWQLKRGRGPVRSFPPGLLVFWTDVLYDSLFPRVDKKIQSQFRIDHHRVDIARFSTP